MNSRSISESRRTESRPDFPPLISTADAVRLTGLSARAVRRLVNEGKIATVHVGRRFCINENSLLNYLNEGDKPAGGGRIEE